MNYQIYMAQTITVGDTMEINGIDWYCFEKCRLVGATPDGIPVVTGQHEAEIATTQFIRASECKSAPKAGSARLVNLILTQYKNIEPEELKDKQIAAVRFTSDALILITAGNEYVKIEPGQGYDSDFELEMADLKVCDLNTMGELSCEDWDEYNGECSRERQAKVDEANFEQFKLAAARIGLGTKAVEKILQST